MYKGVGQGAAILKQAEYRSPGAEIGSGRADMKAFLPLLVILATAGATCPASAGPLEDGLGAYERREFASAREVLAPIAAAGNARAQLVLGKIYLDGQGVEFNGMIAARWFRRAAEQGDAEAQGRLGVLYARGRGVRQDYREAAKWLEVAAKQGNIDAQQCLAGLYVTGEGVSRWPRMKDGRSSAAGRA